MTQPNAIGYYSNSDDTVTEDEANEIFEEYVEWKTEIEMLDKELNPFKVPIGLAPFPLNFTEKNLNSKKALCTLRDSLKKAKEALSTGRYSLLARPNVAYPESSKTTQIVIGSSLDLKRQKTMSGKKKPGLKAPSLKKEQ